MCYRYASAPAVAEDDARGCLTKAVIILHITAVDYQSRRSSSTNTKGFMCVQFTYNLLAGGVALRAPLAIEASEAIFSKR